jgi:hypothetical protein
MVRGRMLRISRSEEAGEIAVVTGTKLLEIILTIYVYDVNPAGISGLKKGNI